MHKDRTSCQSTGCAINIWVRKENSDTSNQSSHTRGLVLCCFLFCLPFTIHLIVMSKSTFSVVVVLLFVVSHPYPPNNSAKLISTM